MLGYWLLLTTKVQAIKGIVIIFAVHVFVCIWEVKKTVNSSWKREDVAETARLELTSQN